MSEMIGESVLVLHWEDGRSVRVPLPPGYDPFKTDVVKLISATAEMLALLEESQRNLTGDWRERRDALLERLNGDEE